MRSGDPITGDKGDSMSGHVRVSVGFATVMRGVLLAAMAMLILIVPATAVEASPRQQTAVDICGRTPEVQTAILAAIGGSATCSTVTDTQLASVTTLEFYSYPNSSIPPADFAGLTGLTSLSFISLRADYRAR